MRAWEEIVGTALTEEDKILNRKGRKLLGLEGDIEDIPLEVVKRAHGMLSAEFLRRDIGHKGRKRVMKDLEEMGYPLESYNRLSSQDLRAYLSTLQSEVRDRMAHYSR